jgi:hypothetical protein
LYLTQNFIHGADTVNYLIESMHEAVAARNSANHDERIDTKIPRGIKLQNIKLKHKSHKKPRRVRQGLLK